MSAVRISSDDRVLYLDGTDASFCVDYSELYELVEAFEDRTGSRRRGHPLFDWHYACDRPPRRGGSVRDTCLEPLSVLRDLKGIEEELTRNEDDYPFKWAFIRRGVGGKEERWRRFSAFLGGRKCFFDSDEDGIWAKEMGRDTRETIHRDLSGESEIRVRLREDDDRDLVFAVRHLSLLRRQAESLEMMKRVCRRAIDEEALLRTAAG